MKQQLRIPCVLALIAVAALAVSPAQATDLYLFDSNASISFAEESAGVYYYDMTLQSLDIPNGAYRDLYIVMDRSYVVHGDAPALPPDVFFVNAEVTSEPGIDLWLSSDQRGFANMNNYDWLDDHRMDLYDPDLVSPLADACYYVAVRMGVNRELTLDEMYHFGYWAGDLRGTKIEGMPFTESDGGPVPEPGTLLLGLAGAAFLWTRFRS